MFDSSDGMFDRYPKGLEIGIPRVLDRFINFFLHELLFLLSLAFSFLLHFPYSASSQL